MFGDHLIKVEGMIDAIRIEQGRGSCSGSSSFIMSPALTSGLSSTGVQIDAAGVHESEVVKHVNLGALPRATAENLRVARAAVWSICRNRT